MVTFGLGNHYWDKLGRQREQREAMDLVTFELRNY